MGRDMTLFCNDCRMKFCSCKDGYNKSIELSGMSREEYFREEYFKNNYISQQAPKHRKELLERFRRSMYFLDHTFDHFNGSDFPYHNEPVLVITGLSFIPQQISTAYARWDHDQKKFIPLEGQEYINFRGNGSSNGAVEREITHWCEPSDFSGLLSDIFEAGLEDKL